MVIAHSASIKGHGFKLGLPACAKALAALPIDPGTASDSGLWVERQPIPGWHELATGTRRFDFSPAVFGGLWPNTFQKARPLGESPLLSQQAMPAQCASMLGSRPLEEGRKSER
jgi:hypothetical protein